jgi:predicted NBD/HSP70 family sugar kinase
VDRTAGRVVFSPLLGWRNVDLAALIERSTALPTVIENDVRAVMIAERWFGAGIGIDNFAVVTIGTGPGCGLVVAGQVLRGSAGVSGELVHLCVDVEGPRCHCGGRGCVEAYVGRAELLAAACRPGSVVVPDLDSALALIAY